MSKESTNVELEPITVVGGELITDAEQKTQIPPEGMLQIDSMENEEFIKLNLSGEWPPKENSKAKNNKGKKTDKKATSTGKKTTTSSTGKKATGTSKQTTDIGTER